MQIGVRILPKEEVLDSQGRTVHKTLEHSGYPVNSCRVGKYVVLDIEATSEEQGLEKAKEISEFVLYNPLTEKYEMEVLNG